MEFVYEPYGRSICGLVSHCLTDRIVSVLLIRLVLAVCPRVSTYVMYKACRNYLGCRLASADTVYKVSYVQHGSKTGSYIFLLLDVVSHSGKIS
jgi:hypothetical protein